MRRLTLFILFLLLQFLFHPLSWAGQDLRETLEHAMLNTRNAIFKKDLDGFLSSIDPVNPRSKITREQWQQVVGNARLRKLLLRGIPDPRHEAIFMAVRSSGEWAAYYGEIDLKDENYQTLKVFLFHRGPDGWRPAGKSYGLTKAKPGGQAAKKGFSAWAGPGEMMEIFETKKEFSLDQLILPEPISR